MIAELLDIIKDFTFGKPSDKKCCKNCGLVLWFKNVTHTDQYGRKFCSSICLNNKYKQDYEKNNIRLEKKNKRKERERRKLWNDRCKYMVNLKPTYFLYDPIFDDLAKYILCTDTERDHIVKLEYREFRKNSTKWDLYYESRIPYYWLSHPLGMSRVMWDKDTNFHNDGVCYCYKNKK